MQPGEDAGVVDHGVEPAEARDRSRDQGLDIRRFAGVRFQELGLAARLADGFVGRQVDVMLLAAPAGRLLDVRADGR